MYESLAGSPWRQKKIEEKNYGIMQLPNGSGCLWRWTKKSKTGEVGSNQRAQRAKEGKDLI